jgi:phenylacetate-coenzyme A ligase PaaK-like adenylate-forming protein
MQSEIPTAEGLARQVFSITNEKEFEQIALAVFQFQYEHNSVYRAYCTTLRKTPETVQTVRQVPFLPISFFKTHTVKAGVFDEEVIFKSSGTTGTATSCHFVKSTSVYEESFLRCFEQFYGHPDSYCILGQLPSYLEQGSSSLVYMVDALVQRSGHPLSGFYLYDFARLNETLKQLESAGQPTVLFGVTYALLNFAEQAGLPLKHTILIETGGMKGRKKELSKPALYEALQQAFSLETVHSEYGMTELLSQAYAQNGRYRCPPWMQITLRDETDPFSVGHSSGAINVIDLANIWSCSFLATEDLGKLHADGSFEVLGRMDNTDIRGCSQLAL